MHFLGIEIGHGGTRAVALDLESAVIRAEAWVPHDWIEGLPAGYREQNPAQWIDAVDRAVRQCLAALEGQKDRVAAIGVAGPQRGLVLLDEANRIIRPAKLAGDVSVKRQADEIARAFGGAPGLIELAGQAPGVESAAAECLWLKQHEPYHFQRAASLLTAQDFIAYWLTGERLTEAGSASGTGLLDIRTRKWSAELLDFIDPRLGSLLPPVPAVPINSGTLILRAPIIIKRKSRRIAASGNAVAPDPRNSGPGSVEPASAPMKCGFCERPCSNELSRKPDPVTPVGASTLISSWSVMGCPFKVKGFLTAD